MVDAAGKSTGSGKYADDLTLPSMLIGKILHSPYPHAFIKGIDTTRAEKLDGVVAVVVGKDAPNPTTAFSPSVTTSMPWQPISRCAMSGDKHVACVAAVDESTAEAMLSNSLTLNTKSYPPTSIPKISMKAESHFIHDNKPHTIWRRTIISTSSATLTKRFRRRRPDRRSSLHRQRSHTRPQWSRTALSRRI